MAGIYTITEYGIVCTCTGGTGTLVIPTINTSTAGIAQTLKVCGCAAGGSATADVVSIYNGNTAGSASTSTGTLFFSGVGSTAGGLVALNLSAPVRIMGPITVTFIGGTNGQAIIYTPSANV